MPAKDLYHDTVKTALLKDGWTITDDPLSLEIVGAICLLTWVLKSYSLPIAVAKKLR